MTSAITTDGRPPTVLIFRSQSGRTEVAREPDGTLSLRVLEGCDELSDTDRITLASVLSTFGPGPEDLAEFDRTNQTALDQTR